VYGLDDCGGGVPLPTGANASVYFTPTRPTSRPTEHLIQSVPGYFPGIKSLKHEADHTQFKGLILVIRNFLWHLETNVEIKFPTRYGNVDVHHLFITLF
jgi:hypothetical protein